jgi:hypothetical protein
VFWYTSLAPSVARPPARPLNGLFFSAAAVTAFETEMSASWRHPELGEFTSEGRWWRAKVDARAEHDVGVLTDGDKILGAGYAFEATPYGFQYE